MENKNNFTNEQNKFINDYYFIAYGKTFIPHRPFNKETNEETYVNSKATSDSMTIKALKNDNDYRYSKYSFEKLAEKYKKDKKIDIFYCVEDKRFFFPTEVGLKCLNVAALRKEYAKELNDFKLSNRNLINQIEHQIQTSILVKNELYIGLIEDAIVLPEVHYSRENYNKLFPRNIVESPIEKVKLGENQFNKLEVKSREKYLGLIYETINNPSIVIDELRIKAENGTQELSHNYIKSFLDDSKVEGFQSVIVNIQNNNVSITNHNRSLENLLSKIKMPEQLIYLNSEVRQIIEQHTLKEQSVVNSTFDFNLAIESAYSTDITRAYNSSYQRIPLLSMIANGDVIAKEPGINVKNISDQILSFENKKTSILDIIGQRFETDKEGKLSMESFKAISRAMEIYSDKHYETARYLFVKDGQILRHITVTSQTPSATAIKPNETFLHNCRRYAINNDAQIVFLHNHPSGYVEPSQEDKELTEYLSNFFSETDQNGDIEKSYFAGHIILDHGSYGLYTDVTKEWQALIDDKVYPIKEAENRFQIQLTEHKILARFEGSDRSISSQSLIQMADYAKKCDSGDLWNKKDWIPSLLLTNNGVVTSLEMFNNAEFKDLQHMAGKLKSLGREYGSENIVFFPNDTRQFLLCESFAQRTGMVKEIYYETDEGFNISNFSNGNIFKLTRGDLKVEDSNDYKKEVEEILFSSESVNKTRDSLKINNDKENKLMDNEEKIEPSISEDVNVAEKNVVTSKELAEKTTSFITGNTFSKRNQENIASLLDALRIQDKILGEKVQLVSEDQIMMAEISIEDFANDMKDIPFAEITVPDEADEGEEQTFHKEKYYLLDSLPEFLKEKVLNFKSEIQFNQNLRNAKLIPLNQINVSDLTEYFIYFIKTLPDSSMSEEMKENIDKKIQSSIEGINSDNENIKKQSFKDLRAFVSATQVIITNFENTSFMNEIQKANSLEAVFDITSRTVHESYVQGHDYTQIEKETSINNANLSEPEKSSNKTGVPYFTDEGNIFIDSEDMSKEDIEKSSKIVDEEAKSHQPKDMSKVIVFDTETTGYNAGVNYHTNVGKYVFENHPELLEEIKNNPGNETTKGLLERLEKYPDGKNFKTILNTMVGEAIAESHPEILEAYEKTLDGKTISIKENLKEKEAPQNLVELPDDNSQQQRLSYSELEKELLELTKNFKTLQEQYTNVMQQNMELRNEISMIKQEHFSKDTESKEVSEQGRRDSQTVSEPGRTDNTGLVFNRENAFIADTVVPKFGKLNKDTGRIEIIENAHFNKLIENEKDNSRNTVLLTVFNTDGSQKSFEVSEMEYNNIIVAQEKLQERKTQISTQGLDESSYEWMVAHMEYNKNLQLDEYKYRLNTASNFLHNFKVHCLREAHNPDEAFKIASEMVNTMPPNEKKKFNQMRKEYGEELFDNKLIHDFNQISKEKEIKESDLKLEGDKLGLIKDYINDANRDYIEIPKGTVIEGTEHTKVGDKVKLAIRTIGFDGKKRKTPSADWKIVSCSKNLPRNMVTLFNEETKSSYTIPVNDFTKYMKKIERNQEKEEVKKIKKDFRLYGYEGRA